MLHTIKRRIFEIIELDNPEDTCSKIFKLFIITLIFGNTLVEVVSTVEDIYQQYQTWLDNFELLSVIILLLNMVCAFGLAMLLLDINIQSGEEYDLC